MPENPILEWIVAYRQLKVLAAACKLKLFTLLAEGPMSVNELSELCRAKPKPLKSLLDTCASLGLLRYEQEKYANLQIADAYLVENRPLYLGHLIHVFSVEAPQWEGLDELMMKGFVPEPESKSDTNPERFTLAMNSLGMLGEAEALAAAVSLPDSRDLVDVGCGSGIYSITLCRHYPHLRATLIDREEVLETTRRLVAESGIADRITLKAGDIFQDDYGKDRDVVLLSDVLYGPPSVCTAILRSAYSALVPRGRLVIRGYFSDPEGTQPPFGTLFDLGRLLWNSKNESLSVKQICLLLQETGFKEIETFAVSNRSSGFTATK